mgnify:CR=1 FL=1
MKVGIIILNAMFLLLLVSVLIAEWGKGPGILAGIAIANTALNSVFIFFKVDNDFKTQQ